MSARVERVAFEPERAAAVRRAAAQTDRMRSRATLLAVGRTLLAGLLSAGLSAGAWQAWRWTTATPLFALREVRFSGISHATGQDLLRRSGLRLGQNLFRLDLARAARGIEGHPWVVSARLERRPPGVVMVDVLEHRPAALVQLGALYVLDDQARIFKRAAPGDALDLPLVTGLSRDGWDENRPGLQVRLLAALQFLDAWRAQGFALAALSEVRLDGEGAVTLFTRDGDEVQEVRLGAQDFALKLGRLAQMRATLSRRGERATRIDLDNPARPDQATAALAHKGR